jgi:4-hydroxy-tetrahydrodipicolinate reductase
VAQTGSPVGLAVFGITGRMGQSLISALREGSQFELRAAMASPASSRLGKDAAAQGTPSGVSVVVDSPAALVRCAAAVDFSLAAAVAAHAGACAAARVPLLVGTTGFDGATHGELERAARVIPVLIAPNTSVGVAVLRKLVAIAAAGLGPAYAVEIAEAHHLMKRDAPSGTALSLGEVVAAVRGRPLSELAVYEAPASRAARTADSIGFTVVRSGDIVGEHTVSFETADERVDITHRATDRKTFARGALQAAAWLIGRPPGLYGMQDVLGL